MDPILGGALAGGGLSAAGSILGGVGASRRAKRARRRVRRLVGFAAQQAEAEAERIQQSEEFQLARDFYLSYGREGVPSWMQDIAADRLRTAGAARGVAYGGAGARQESLALTSMAERGRAAAAPALLQLAETPLRLKETAFQHFLGRTGLGMGVTNFGPDPLEIAGGALASGVQGALGGAQLGLGIAELNKQPLTQRRDSVVQPASGFNSPAAAQSIQSASRVAPQNAANYLQAFGAGFNQMGLMARNPGLINLGMGLVGGRF